MEIRMATPDDDFLAISRIYARSWKAAFKGIVPQAYLDGLRDDRWAELWKGRSVDMVVLLECGQYIGTSAFCPARDEAMTGFGEIISIYLLPEFYGKGYGTPLLEAAVRELQARGFERIYLWALEENARARAFYAKNGFRETEDRMPLTIGGKELTEVRYVRA